MWWPIAAILVSLLLVSSCNASGGAGGDTATIAKTGTPGETPTTDPPPRTADPELASTTWEVVKISDPDGVVHLPFADSPDQPVVFNPTVSYDENGVFSWAHDGYTRYDRTEFPDLLESSTIQDLNPNLRYAFSELGAPPHVLVSGGPTRNGSTLTLELRGFTAELALRPQSREHSR